MTAGDQHRQLHRLGAAEFGEGVECSAHRAPGEEHVVDQHDRAAGDVDGNLGGTGRRDRAQRDVVAEEGDVERANGHLDVLELRDRGGEAVGDGDAPGVETDEHDVVGTTVALDDLVGDAGVGPAQVAGIEHTRPVDEVHVVAFP